MHFAAFTKFQITEHIFLLFHRWNRKHETRLVLEAKLTKSPDGRTDRHVVMI